MDNGIGDDGLAAILRGFTARLAEISEGGGHQWQISSGVYIFPEGRCPYCDEPIRSNRIWRIEDRQLLGRWKIVGNRLVKERRPVGNEFYFHPHVNGTAICQGSAATGADALFVGMSPRNSYDSNQNTWDLFLREVWDHECAVMPPPPPPPSPCTHRCCVDCCTLRACTTGPFAAAVADRIAAREAAGEDYSGDEDEDSDEIDLFDGEDDDEDL